MTQDIIPIQRTKTSVFPQKVEPPVAESIPTPAPVTTSIPIATTVPDVVVKKKLEKRKWTPEEDKYLLENYVTQKIKDVGTHLNRTENAIKRRAKKLNCSKETRQKWTEEELEIIRVAGKNCELVKQLIPHRTMNSIYHKVEESRMGKCLYCGKKIRRRKKYCNGTCKFSFSKHGEKIRRNDVKIPHVVCYSGGIDSTAMIIGMLQNKIDIDIIVFVDGGCEMPHTYEYIKTFSEWLKNNGLPEITVLKTKYRLDEYCVKNKTLPSITFGGRGCSDTFKKKPIERMLKKHDLIKMSLRALKKPIIYYGYTVDEKRRARYIKENLCNKKFPLIEWGWTKDICKQIILHAGLPLPGPSRCYFCPKTSKDDVVWLSKTYPELYQKALDIEVAAKERLVSVAGLGNRWSWADVTKDVVV